MLPPELETLLAEAEFQFDAVSAAIGSGDPVSLESASADLRKAAVDFASFMGEIDPNILTSKEFRLRVKSIADGMAIQRENLIRRTVTVERALHAMVPATQAATYSQAAGPYGSGAKQTGAFKLLSA